MKNLGSINNAKDLITKEYLEEHAQEKLVSGTNIKTINNKDILGQGNLDILEGESLPVGTEVDYGGTEIPEGWQAVDDIIVDTLSGNETNKAPSVHAVNAKIGDIETILDSINGEVI